MHLTLTCRVHSHCHADPLVVTVSLLAVIAFAVINVAGAHVFFKRADVGAQGDKILRTSLRRALLIKNSRF